MVIRTGDLHTNSLQFENGPFTYHIFGMCLILGCEAAESQDFTTQCTINTRKWTPESVVQLFNEPEFGVCGCSGPLKNYSQHPTSRSRQPGDSSGAYVLFMAAQERGVVGSQRGSLGVQTSSPTSTTSSCRQMRKTQSCFVSSFWPPYSPTWMPSGPGCTPQSRSALLWDPRRSLTPSLASPPRRASCQ